MYNPRAALCVFLNSLATKHRPITGGDVQCSKNIISQYNLLYMKTIGMFKIPGTFRPCFSRQTIAPEEYCHQGDTYTFLKDTKVPNQSTLDDENNGENSPKFLA